MIKFQDKVVYQIYPKSFNDSNQDGIGDIRGIIEKLDYLKMLGVDYIWSTPFFISPQNDNGYDVADYLNVDPSFGTMEDVEELIAEAEKRGIGLMFDMVFNHTSTNHPWFKEALSGNKKYIDYYIFKDGAPDKLPTNWQSKFGGPAWEYVPHLNKWYLHLFDKTQADLNWNNPEVREELKNVIRFWKQKGIKGFRFDVVNLISKPEIFMDDDQGDGRRFYTDGPHVHEFLKELVKDTGMEDMLTVGEMSSTSIDHCIRYSAPEEKELSMVFNFHHLKVDYKDGDKWTLKEADIEELKRLFEHWQIGMQNKNGWNALFWCNHDQPRIVSRLGDCKKYWKESSKMLATCTHLMRGTPYIYQGEELGMTNAYFTEIGQYKDVESLNYYEILREQGLTNQEALKVLGERSRDNGRTPMQWNTEENGGFSSCEPWIEVNKNYREINAAEQMVDDDSVFNYYRKLINLRKQKAVIAEGTIEFIARNTENVIAYKRSLGQEELIVFNNFSNKTTSVMLPVDLNEYKGVIGNYNSDFIVKENTIELRPYETVVLEKVVNTVNL